MTVAMLETDVRPVRLSDLALHPRNASKPLGSDIDRLRDLAASMAAVGLLQPVIVRPLRGENVPASGALFQLVAGRRRMAAAESLGWTEIPANIRELTDAEALAVIVTENAERVDPDPFLEAAALDELYAIEGNVRAVAARLAKPVAWVAQHRALSMLEQTARAFALEHAWTPAHMATFARLSGPAQLAALEANANGKGAGHLEGDPLPLSLLEAVVDSEIRVLGNAPFDFKDERLARPAGACVLCPKTSLGSPGLFDDGGAEEKAPDWETVKCRDGACWAKKCAASVKLAVSRLRAEHGDALAVVALPGAERVKGGGKPLPPYSWEKVKKGTEGATAAAVLNADGSVTFGTVKIRKEPKAAPAGAVAPRTQSPAERLKALEAEHRDAVDRRALQLTGDAIATVKGPPTVRRAIAAALVFGVGFWHEAGPAPALRRLKLARLLLDDAGAIDKAAGVLWDAAQESARNGDDYNGDDEAVAEEAFGVLCALAGTTPKFMRHDAAVELPDPPALVALRAEVNGPPGATAPPAAAKPAKKKPAGKPARKKASKSKR